MPVERFRSRGQEPEYRAMMTTLMTTPLAAAGAELTFLTRYGCRNTAILRGRLDEALRHLGRPTTYEVVDVEAVPATDVRAGYGTPTVLLAGRDLFGMPEPDIAETGAT